MKRHPCISLQSPEYFQLRRIRCCTPEAVDEWYAGFNQFLLTHSLKDQPHHVWNADKSAFRLCYNIGKVIAIHNSCSIYSITSDTKEQITTLCAATAAGDNATIAHFFWWKASKQLNGKVCWWCIPSQVTKWFDSNRDILQLASQSLCKACHWTASCSCQWS